MVEYDDLLILLQFGNDSAISSQRFFSRNYPSDSGDTCSSLSGSDADECGNSSSSQINFLTADEGILGASSFNTQESPRTSEPVAFDEEIQPSDLNEGPRTPSECSIRWCSLVRRLIFNYIITTNH